MREVKRPYSQYPMFNDVGTSAHLIECMDIIFKADKDFIVRLPNGDAILIGTEKDAIRTAAQTLNNVVGYSAEPEAIKLLQGIVGQYVKYFLPANCFMGRVPGKGPLLVSDGRICVNSWTDNRVQVAKTEGQAWRFLKLLHDNLCGGDPLPRKEDYYKVSERIVEYQYLISFLAAMYQKPGDSFTTAPLIKTVRGGGKDTFKTVVELMMGVNRSLIQVRDLQNGFNESLSGLDFAVWNELSHINDGGTCTKLLDQYIGSSSFSLRIKGARGSHEAMCPGFHVLLTADELGWSVPKDERRLVFIQGNPDEGCKIYSEKFYNDWFYPQFKIKDIARVEEVANFLWNYTVDDKFRHRAPTTKWKTDSVRKSHPLLQFMVDADRTAGWVSSQALYLKYKAWYQKYYPNSRIMNVNSFSAKLSSFSKEIGEHGVVITDGSQPGDRRSNQRGRVITRPGAAEKSNVVNFFPKIQSDKDDD